MIVGGKRNKLLGGSIEGVRNGIVVDSNQHYTHDGKPHPSTGNSIDNVSMSDVFFRN